MNNLCRQNAILEHYLSELNQASLDETQLTNSPASLNIQAFMVRKAIVLNELSNMENQLNTVVPMVNTAGQKTEIVIMQIHSFDQGFLAVQALMERKTVVLNLTHLAPDLAQRIIDVIAGGAYAIDGHQERVGKNVFLFTSGSVQISQSLA